MARTNIDLDEEAVAAVMRRFDLKTKRDAVNFALRRVAGPPVNVEALLALEGVGWGGDLDEIRDAPAREWSDEGAAADPAGRPGGGRGPA